MTTTQPATAPAAPATQSPCLHPSCHAHLAHPGNRPQQPAAPAQPRTSAITWLRSRWTKNWTIGFLIVIIIGLAGSLNDDDHKIADLKASHSSTQSTQTSKMAKLQYAIAYCGQVAAKGDGPECIQETLDAQH